MRRHMADIYPYRAHLFYRKKTIRGSHRKLICRLRRSSSISAAITDEMRNWKMPSRPFSVGNFSSWLIHGVPKGVC